MMEKLHRKAVYMDCGRNYAEDGVGDLDSGH